MAATYINALPSNMSFISAKSITFEVTSLQNIDVTDTVDNWINGGQFNYGFFVDSYNFSPWDCHGAFYARDLGTSYAPDLYIEYKE